MAIVEIDSLEFPGVELFSSLTEKQLRHSYEKGSGVFIVESPKVIDRALIEGYKPLALLCEQRHVVGDAAEIISRCGDIPVYTGSRELLASLTGYVLTRGVLCAMRRPAELSVEEVCRDARRVVVIDGVVDATNVGAMFRSAAALGIDAVLMTRTSCDPLNRRAVVRAIAAVRKPYRFRTAAMALTDNSVSIDDVALLAEPRLAIVMGNEGDGLPAATIAAADYVVRIPMARGIDSLNVAAAAAVAFWQLR